MDLFVAKPLKFLCFSDDLTCRAAAFASARVRHDAKRAELVAAFDDWNESDMWRVSLDWRNVPGFVVTALAEVKHSLFAVARAFDQYGKAIGRTGSDHQVD